MRSKFLKSETDKLTAEMNEATAFIADYRKMKIFLNRAC